MQHFSVFTRLSVCTKYDNIKIPRWILNDIMSALHCYFPEVREHPGHDDVGELGHGVARSFDVAEGGDDDARRRRGGQDPSANASLGPKCGYTHYVL